MSFHALSHEQLQALLLTDVRDGRLHIDVPLQVTDRGMLGAASGIGVLGRAVTGSLAAVRLEAINCLLAPCPDD